MIFAEGATVVAYALLDICRDVFGMSQELREKYISTKLTYGDSEATYINGLIESVTRYANEMLAEKIQRNTIIKIWWKGWRFRHHIILKIVLQLLRELTITRNGILICYET